VGNRKLLKEVADAANEGKDIFNLLRPMPDNIFQGNLGKEERELYGENNWYDWSVAHWGTKWDTDAHNSFFDGETLTLSFDTAWSPPIELYEYLVEQGFSVLADYYEPGMAFAGIYEDGEDRAYDDVSDEFLENDADGKLLDETYGILQERAQYDEEYE
jgi:hypothetical protein